MSDSIINLQYTIIREPLPDFIRKNLQQFVNNSNAYQPQPLELRQMLSEKYTQPVENIMLTAGIDEGIQLFAMAYGAESVIFTPTYTVYEEIPNFGPNNLHKVYSLSNDRYHISPQQFPSATLICLVNPNNPCGEIGLDTIEEILQKNPQAIITIDEAYGEFVKYSAMPLVKKYLNIAVMRSFSKAYGMAGARVAYTVAHPEIINKLKQKTQWCNVSYLSVGAALAALNNEEYYQKMRQRLNIEQDALVTFLLDHKFTIIPSAINAVLIKFNSSDLATNFVAYLMENNIIVSHGNGNSNCGLDQSFVRISVGKEDQMTYAKSIIERYAS